MIFGIGERSRTGNQSHSSGHRACCDHAIFQKRPAIAAVVYGSIFLHLFLLFLETKLKYLQKSVHTRVMTGRAFPLGSGIAARVTPWSERSAVNFTRRATEPNLS